MQSFLLLDHMVSHLRVSSNLLSRDFRPKAPPSSCVVLRVHLRSIGDLLVMEQSES